MNLAEYTDYDGLGLAELVRDRQVSPQELRAAAFEAIEAVDPVINAVVETYDDGAGDADPGAPFAGVPFMLKDLGFHEAGRPSTSGSRLLAGHRVEQDSELMRRFRRAGLVSVGRTSSSEFGIAATVETLAFGTTRNPWDLTRTASGSSGGAGAAVAAGIVPIAHGSDAGGSIRMPAACCGVVGTKPTRGRVSPAPGGPSLGGFDHEFALTRSVRDAAALLDAVHGAAPGDPFEIPAPDRSFLSALSEPPRRLRIAFTTRALDGGAVDPELAAAVERTVRVCEEMGHEVIEAAPALPYAAFQAACLDLWCGLTAAGVDAAAALTGRSTDHQTLEGLTLAWAARGRTLPAPDLAVALDTMNDVNRRVGAFFEDVDVLLTSTLPTLPPALGLYDPAADLPPTWYYASAIGRLETTTMVFNCTGQPAMSLPLQTAASGLPIGIHIACRFGDERTMLALAGELEDALPWRARRPPVHAAAPPRRE